MNGENEILVVDFEATCWKGEVPEGEFSEIIEIGWAKYDFGLKKILDHGGIYVKPGNSRVSEFCTELTGITQDTVDGGVSFLEAAKMVKKLGSKNMPWASWGQYDHNLARIQSGRLAMANPFGSQHLNIKAMFGVLMGLRKAPGMDGALSMVGYNLIGRHHSGADDAYNIARILRWMHVAFEGAAPEYVG